MMRIEQDPDEDRGFIEFAKSDLRARIAVKEIILPAIERLRRKRQMSHKSGKEVTS